MSLLMHFQRSYRCTSFFSLTSLAVVVILFTGCSENVEPIAPELKPRPVKVVSIASGDELDSRTYPASVRAAERIDLSFEVPGKIIKLPAQEGQLLEKGALVAQLDQRDFRSTADEARARYNNAAANFQRAKDLLEKKFISPAEYDRLKSNMQVTKAQMEKAEKALESTKLIAPFSGRIAVRHVENYQEIQAKQTIVSLQGSDFLELVVYVPERIMATVKDVRKDATVKAQFDALPGKSFDVTIKEYSTQADPVTQTFRFVLQMPRPADSNILPGMTAKVIATRTNRPEALDFVLPTSAIAADEAGNTNVWLVEDNKTKRQPVTLGNLIGEDKVSILKGLSPGNVIVVAGVSKLREGMSVRPIEKVEF